MPLSNEQIRELVKRRPHEKEIRAGVSHQNRLKFHSETVLHKHDLSSYYDDFKAWLGSPKDDEPELLAKDKFDRLISLIHAPIQTVELTEGIYSRLYRIFYAQDAYFNYRFTDDSLETDWAEFRDNQFWQVKGFEAMQTAIDSVWIAALPSEQFTEFPEPEDRLIDIENVIEIQNDKYNNCLYVIFQLGDYVYVYDDSSFRVFDANSMGLEPVEAIHDLGYCPARMFWSDKLTSKNDINKESPITKELTDLDWLLFHMTSKRYMDLANAYPITVIYKPEGNYDDDKITDNEQRQTGKKPTGADLAGSGSLVVVDVPRSAEEVDPMQYGPIKIIAPDVTSLDWHVKEETRLTDKIFRSVVGIEQEIKDSEAYNEMQMQGSYESQKSVLLKVKKNFETIHKFADETICKLRYGERFVGCEIDYGTNFFLKDLSDLQEDMKEAKESGASEVIVSSIGDNILNTRYRDDKNNRQRADIVDDLDPLPNKTMEEAINIFDKGGIDKRNFIIKSNLLSFVRRFERENTDVVNFGSLMNYNKKIEQILESFKMYAEEMIIVEPKIKEDEVND